MGYKPHILVVDDSGLLRRQVVSELSQLNATFREAANGLEALAAVHQQKPDLITLDIEMPKLDGYGVCRMLSANPNTIGIPVVMISSKMDNEERLRAFESGAVEYFLKPFDAGSLRRLAQTILGRVRNNRQRHIFSISSDQELEKQLDGPLLRNGYQHRIFKDLDELLQAFEERPCNLLLLDFRLSERGAYRVLDALRRTTEGLGTKVIALASQGARRDLVNAYFSGASDFVRVPFYSEELLARIERQLYVQNEESELRNLATVDPLTRLSNRGELERCAAIEITRAVNDNRSLGILIVDIDHFKQLNDGHGHTVGDEVLRRVARTLSVGVRETDTMGRYGGEEFLALLPGATGDSLNTVAERLRSSVEDLLIETEDTALQTTVSIGGYTWQPSTLPPNLTFGKLVKPADDALYRAKSEGRNRCVLTVPSAPSSGRLRTG